MIGSEARKNHTHARTHTHNTHNTYNILLTVDEKVNVTDILQMRHAHDRQNTIYHPGIWEITLRHIN